MVFETFVQVGPRSRSDLKVSDLGFITFTEGTMHSYNGISEVDSLNMCVGHKSICQALRTLWEKEKLLVK